MEKLLQKKEMLYRAIKRSKPDWLDDLGKPTPYMYKDADGNSVDRDGNRDLEEIISFMDNGVFKKRLKGVVEVNAGVCMDIGATVIEAANDENPYHANIFISEDDMIGPIQSLMIADASKVVYMNKKMSWVYL